MATVRSCRHCGGELASVRAWFCSTGCRQAAFRRRRAGVPEDAYPLNGRRGRVALAEPTRMERASSLLAARRR